MAYVRTSYFDCTSQGNLRYRVEFYDQGDGGAGVAATFQNQKRKAAPNAVQIKWGSDGSKLFAPLKPSTCQINLMVDDFRCAKYVAELRTRRQERDVYVAVYREYLSGNDEPQYGPIWGGFLLMDLSDDPDISLPWSVTLKAVDGIASMKYYDYIPPGTTQSADGLYNKLDTYIADPGNTQPTWRHFIEIISDCLDKSGPFTTNEGNTNNPTFKTGARWFNGQFASLGINPLRDTRVRPEIFYTEEEVADDYIKYKPMSCYEVIKAVCKGWGMRMVYWQNVYYFIQINEWDNAQSGTQANPDDITNWEYAMDGSTIGGINQSLEGWWHTYQLYLTNAGPIQSNVKWNKLAGGQYGILPAFKKVTIDFLNVSNNNLFTRFPLMFPDPNPAVTVPGNFAGGFMYESMGIFTCDGLTDLNFFQRINLAWHNNSTISGNFLTDWVIVARPHAPGNAPWDNSLGPGGQPQPATLYMKGSSAPSGIEWLDMFSLGWFGFPFDSHQSLPTGNTTKCITTGSGVNQTNAKTYPVITAFDVSAAAVFYAGDWELAYCIKSSVDAGPIDSATGNPVPSGYWYNHGTFYPSGNAVSGPNQGPPSGNVTNPWYHGVGYTNVALTQGLGSSEFCPIVNGAVGVTTSITNMVQPGNDTAFEVITNVLFGDTGSTATLGCLQIYDGTSWIVSDFSGIWGIDTLGGGNSFAEQLATDIFQAQSKPIHKFSVQTTNDPQRGFYWNDGTANRPQYPCPLTKWITPGHGASVTSAKYWMMHTGEFNLVEDTWKWVFYEQKKFAPPDDVIIIIDDGGYGPGDDVGHGGAQGKYASGIIKVATDEEAPTKVMPRLGQPAEGVEAEVQSLERGRTKPIAIINEAQIIDASATGTPVYELVITELEVLELADSVFKAGDLFILNTQTNGKRAEGDPTDPIIINEWEGAQALPDNQLLFEVETDQAAGTTTIAVIEQTIYQDISIGDTIVPYTEDLFSQYQNKTKGTIGGFEVDSDGIQKDGIRITTLIDDDTMADASEESLATSESIKRYVDAQPHSIDEFMMATCDAPASTSATNGEAYAVIIPFENVAVEGDADHITLSTIAGEENNFRLTEGKYIFQWNVAANTSVTNNRLNCGVKLQIGTWNEGEGIWDYADLFPTHGYIYNRANGSVARLGSTAGSLIVDQDGTDHLYRLVFWKDSSSSGTTVGITVLDGTQINIRQLST